MAVRWLTAFWDYPAEGYEAGIAFWLKATGSTLSPRRGPDGEFATLIPAEGDACLRVQRVREGNGGCHLDLHVDDVAVEADYALRIGATAVYEEPGLAVLRSPSRFPFCIVDHHGESRLPVSAQWPDGSRSVADQLCVDIPPSVFDREVEFWTALTGWPTVPSDSPEFLRLNVPREVPLGILLQRLDSAAPGAAPTAHVDLACSDVEAETARHIALGATAIRRHDLWQVMRDPAGLEYCNTQRRPR